MNCTCEYCNILHKPCVLCSGVLPDWYPLPHYPDAANVAASECGCECGCGGEGTVEVVEGGKGNTVEVVEGGKGVVEGGKGNNCVNSCTCKRMHS